ncbi:MAG: hypothetical protein J6Y24_02415 [Bacteroidales bacterium]|nr:hypothetical protein [Bacteroidales bacterium]
MIKKLALVAAVMSVCCGAMAQEGGSGLSTNNKFQVSLLMGNQANFSGSDFGKLTPSYDGTNKVDAGVIGGVEPSAMLTLNGLGESALNFAGIQFAYYLADNMDVNLQFGMEICKTPQKDYVGQLHQATNVVPAQLAIDGTVTNHYLVNAGYNYHLGTSNEKVDLYVGAQVGYQNARITTNYAWDGNVYLLRPEQDKGMFHLISGAAVAGVSYSFVPGFSIGFETAPVAYNYAMVEVATPGFGTYQADSHVFRFLANPMLKLGIRF